MTTEVALPDHLVRELSQKVQQGEYPDLATAITELVRLGLATKENQKKGGGGGMPSNMPSSEDPSSTSPDPSDVNWM